MLDSRVASSGGDGECFLLRPGTRGACGTRRARRTTSRKARAPPAGTGASPPRRCARAESTPAATRPELKIGTVNDGTTQNEALRAEYLAVARCSAADPDRARQEHAREVVGLGDADARGGRGELFLGLAHVGSPLEQARRQTRRAPRARRSARRAAGRAAPAPGGRPEQDADHVLRSARSGARCPGSSRAAVATRISACRTSIMAATPPDSRQLDEVEATLVASRACGERSRAPGPATRSWK